MENGLLNIGFGCTVVDRCVVSIVSPNSAPMKRLKDEAKECGRLIDATHGRKTRSIIVSDSFHVILSSIQAETIAQRYSTLHGDVPEQSLLSIGFGSTLVADRIVSIMVPNSAPMKRLKDEAKAAKRLVDATHGRKTRSMIIMNSNHIVLSSIQAETISQRFKTLNAVINES